MSTNFFDASTKMMPFVASTTLLSGVYYSAFNMYSDSVESSEWVFLYRFFQCMITTHLMTLSWFTKYNKRNIFVASTYIISLVSFYSMATLVIFNDYFIDLRTQNDFKIIQDVYYNSITTMIQYFILYEMKANIQMGMDVMKK